MARWHGSHKCWYLCGDGGPLHAVKVGVGGTLDAPPDVWDDDLPVGVTTVTWRGDPEHGWSQSLRVDLSSYGTDDPDRTP